MEQITIGQIGLAVTFIVGLITGITALVKNIKKWLSSAFKADFEKINSKIDKVQKRVDDVDLAHCKNYLVRFLSDVDQGKEIDDIELERFWEQFQHYESIGGNSYIHRKVEQLKTEGKL